MMLLNLDLKTIKKTNLFINIKSINLLCSFQKTYL